MPHYYNKIFLLTFLLLVLLFFSPHNAEALTCNPPDVQSFGACSSFICPINNTTGSQREERCRSADGSVISQPDYYASSDCSGNTGFCPSQCDPNNQAFCKCYSGSVTATQACQGNHGSTGPYWCHNISCGSYCSGSPDYIEVQKQATAVDYAKPAYVASTCKAPPACICPAASDVACGAVSNTPTNSPCTGSCPSVVGTKNCPTCTLTSDKGTVNSGESTTLRWITDNSPATCTASGDWNS